MSEKNILIATNSLGIGGCETYILTMTKELINREKSVVIVAADGMLKNNFENIGAKVYEINFFNRELCMENIKKIEYIIQKEKITDAAINPFYPFFEAVSACIKQKIPYSLFFHGVSLKGYFDIQNSFSALGVWSNLFIDNIAIKYANGYVYASNEIRDFYEKSFNLDKNKGIVLKNSIETQIQLKPTKKINKIAMLSRIDPDKANSIKYAIEFYKELYDKSPNNENMCFDIMGTGSKENEIKEIIKKNESYNINLLEATNNSIESIKQYDVILGMGRSIIEAMSLKKLAVLISYDKYIGLVDARNNNKMEEIAYANFSGRNIQERNIENCIQEIQNLTQESIEEILNENYKYIVKNQSIKTNIIEYLERIEEKHTNFEETDKDLKEYLRIVEYIVALEKDNNKIASQLKNITAMQRAVNEQYEEAKKKEEKYMEEAKINQNEIEHLKKLLNDIYNKKTYKFYKKFKQLINKEK